jgi:hypothetical protein
MAVDLDGEYCERAVVEEAWDEHEIPMYGDNGDSAVQPTRLSRLDVDAMHSKSLSPGIVRMC